jgi:hypothetical protein
MLIRIAYCARKELILKSICPAMCFPKFNGTSHVVRRQNDVFRASLKQSCSKFLERSKQTVVSESLAVPTKYFYEL